MFGWLMHGAWCYLRLVVARRHAVVNVCAVALLNMEPCLLADFSVRSAKEQLVLHATSDRSLLANLLPQSSFLVVDTGYILQNA